MTRRWADLDRVHQVAAVLARQGMATFRDALADPRPLVDLGADPVRLAGYPHPAYWIDSDGASVAIGQSGHTGPGTCGCDDPECPGMAVYDLLAIVAIHEGRWWWSAMLPCHTSEIPEETQADARSAVERRYAKAAG